MVRNRSEKNQAVKRMEKSKRNVIITSRVFSLVLMTMKKDTPTIGRNKDRPDLRNDVRKISIA